MLLPDLRMQGVVKSINVVFHNLVNRRQGFQLGGDSDLKALL